MMTRRLLLGAGIALSATGCWGGFGLTRKLYDWNSRVGNKWVVWLVFFLFAFLPVYGVCVMVDALVLNSIEFWTGQNPMGLNAPASLGNLEKERTFEQEDGTKITMTRLGATSMRIVRRAPSGDVLDGLELVMDGERAGQVRTLAGEVLVAQERLTDGTLAVTYHGETTFVSPQQQEQIASSENFVVAAGALLPPGRALALR
jgi:hypothetical protein